MKITTPEAENTPEQSKDGNGRRYNLIFSTLVFFTLSLFTLDYFQTNSLKKLKRERNEYSFIAESLVRGYGYSNPFGSCSLAEHEYLCSPAEDVLIEDSPVAVVATTWMPPVYPVILAIVFFLFGVKSTLSLVIILWLKILGFSFAHFWLQKLLFRGHPRILDRLVASCLFCLTFLLHEEHIFNALHDIWLLVPLSLISITFLLRIFENTLTKKELAGFSLFAMILPLTNATMGYTFFCLSLLCYSFVSSQSKRAIQIVLLSFICALSLWTFRNVQAMDALILNKSNLWFDFYQAQALDDDGIVSYSTFQLHHPITAPSERIRYMSTSEATYIDSYKERSLTYLQTSKQDYFIRIARRFINVLSPKTPLDAYSVDLNSQPKEVLAKLLKLKLITYSPNYESYFWINLDKDLTDREQLLNGFFSPETATRLNAALLTAKKTYQHQRILPAKVWQSRLMGTLPALCILLGLCWQRVRTATLFRISVLFYTVYVTPYILISHYQRYQMALAGVQVLLMLIIYLALREHHCDKEGTRITQCAKAGDCSC